MYITIYEDSKRNIVTDKTEFKIVHCSILKLIKKYNYKLLTIKEE